MGIGAGILIAAVGAVLAFAVTAEVNGVDVQTIGVIMIIAGLAVALIAAIATASSRRRVVTSGYVAERPVVTQPVVERVVAPAPRRRVIVEEPPVDGNRI